MAADRPVMALRPTPADAVTPFHRWLQEVFDQRFTGPVTIHFLNGRAHVVEIAGPATRIALDSRGGK